MVILVNECISHIDDGDGYGYAGGDDDDDDDFSGDDDDGDSGGLSPSIKPFLTETAAQTLFVSHFAALL